MDSNTYCRESPEMREVLGNEDYIHFVGLVEPPVPGVIPFSVALKYNYFPPNSSKNKQYKDITIGCQELVWVIISVPKRYMESAQKISGKYGVVIKKAEEGIKFLEKTITLPIWGANIYGLVCDPGYYPGLSLPEDREAIIEKESARIENIILDACGVNMAYV